MKIAAHTPLSRAAMLALVMLLTIALYGALTLTGPTWSPTSAFTNNTLTCTWSNTTDTIAQNITLLRNSVLWNTTYENATAVTLSSNLTVSAANTTKNDIWTCRITLDNGTASVTAETNVTILNSPPTTEGSGAGIFTPAGTDVGFIIHIAEDTTLMLDVNATDADTDTLTYLAADAFCVRNSSSAGTYLCSPVQADLDSNNVTTLVNITFTASDGQNVGGRTITFNLTPVNDAPTLSLSSQTTPVNQSKNITFSTTDEEGDYPLTYLLTAPAEVADRLSIARLNPLGTSFSVYYDASVPDFNDVGLWNVIINVTDQSTNISGGNNSKSAIQNFTFNISAVGRNPYFVAITPASPYAGSQGQFLQINITANDSDINTTMVFTDDTSRFAISTVNSSNAGSALATGQINFTPTNADVGTYNVTITITDAESLTNTTQLVFIIANVNDAPTIAEMSTNASNTGGNVNASNLTLYVSARFVYVMNTTDADSIHGDTLTYADNTTLFDIDATTGIINFTPTSGQTGTHHINITVTDNASSVANRTITLTINPNTPPYFNATVPGLNCTTDATCSFGLNGYAVDPDIGDNITTYTITLNTTLSSFSLNTTSGLINFTPQKEEVAHYLVNLTITDFFGATNSTTFTLRINNTPVSPNFTRYNLSTETIVELHAVSYELRAMDQDFRVPGSIETVSFSSNLSINHTFTPLAALNTTTARALITFTPQLGDAGNYTITLTATDAFEINTTRTVTFEILPAVPPPNITQITPWGANNATHNIETSYASTAESQFLDLVADVTIPENTTVLFNATVNDTRPVTYNWTVNGSVVSTAQNYTTSYGFFSAGSYAVYLNVTNDRLESSGFRWDVVVSNTNRAPLLFTALGTPLSVNGTASYSDYFILGNGTRFIDPDDDLDSSNTINGAEANTLTFAANQSCAVATITTSGGSLTIQGSSEGFCVVGFTATDAGGLTRTSAAVNITVVDVPEGAPETSTTTSSGGGGGSSSPTYIPISRDRETPKAFDLIAPSLVTLYENDSIEIPITINNTWRSKLDFISIVATTNATGVTTTLSSDLIESLAINNSQELTLTVTGYRLGENYEVLVTANVSNPLYGDSALILLNSLQSSSDGDEVDVKVTFANDLLSEHPECQELNEVLDQAKERLAQNRITEAGQLVDAVISGCRYLVSTKERIEEKPGRIDPIISFDDLSVRTVLWSALVFVMLTSIALIAYYHYTRRPEDDI